MSLHRLISRALWLTLTFAACDGATEGPDAVAEVAAPLSAFKAPIRKGTLSIVGGSTDSSLALRLAPNNMLALDDGDDGTADFLFDRSKFTSIVVDAGGGADLVRIDDSQGLVSVSG